MPGLEPRFGGPNPPVLTAALHRRVCEWNRTTPKFEKIFYSKNKSGETLHKLCPAIGAEGSQSPIIYFNLIIDKMNSGGVILSDNVPWSGKVVEELNEKDIDTKTLLEFNKLLNTDERLETVLLPIRDGLTISRVK